MAVRIGAAVLVWLIATGAAAQPVRAYAGVGGSLVFDQAPRVVIGAIEEADSSRALVVDAGIFVLPRTAVGFEVTKLDDARASTSGHFGTIADTETESTISGHVRVVLLRRRYGAIAAVGGAGVLQSSTTTSLTSNDPRTPSTLRTVDRRLLLWSAGVDALAAPVRHVAVGPIVRLYWPRGEEPAPQFPGETFDLAQRSTTRAVVGVIVRGEW